jgi:HAD superfamily hydrolase (TIGR01548 family)
VNALLFDMDGVLVDVASSYRRAVRLTVRHFAGVDIGEAEIQAYKDRGGLNNDWDLTGAVLSDRGIEPGRESIVGVFQGFYAGKDFNGLIRDERWLLDPGILAGLAKRFAVGIVTGRPSAETRFTLGHFGVARYFPVVVTMDDLPPDRGKPDPLGIRLAMKALGERDGFYVGDTIDDMRAARRAGLVPIGVAGDGRGAGAAEARLRTEGAEKIICDIRRIEEVLP